uniref:MBL fold metallo-hydrolase n=1 Tax=Corynebacterium poyangense TaxID=2684405 RepID=UPI0021CD8CC8|nr:MBL fold metallo-hydrolase [Corynebacterium poyangense]
MSLSLKSRKRLMALCGVTILSGSLLVGCSSDNGKGGPHVSVEDADAGPFGEAAAANINRNVSDDYEATPQILADSDGSGSEAVARFHDTSETLIISDSKDASQLRAASIAVFTHTPMLMLSDKNSKSIKESIKQLQPGKVLLVGNIDEKSVTPDPDPTTDSPDKPAINFIRDNGTAEGLEALTATQFTEQEVDRPEDMVKAVVGLNGKDAVLLKPTWEQFVPSPQAQGTPEALPAGTAEDGNSAPITIASPQSAVAAVGTARAYGVEVRYMDYPDPRLSDDTMKMVAGLSNRPLLALGYQFGSGKTLSEKIERGEHVTAELPGGGRLVFPGRRMIALYGHPSGPALGAMGEQDPAASVKRVKDLVDQYQGMSKEPVIPAFEVIASVASADPGPDGTYSNVFPEQELRPYVDAIINAGGYAVIDLQPGKASLLDQAKKYENLLKEPNVGLALDPEWKLEPGELPMSQVGHVDASEIDQVSEWLSKLVDDNKLPQKALVLHQFQLQMIRNRELLNLDHPELAFVLHADGHGSREQKFDTWDAMRRDLDPRFFMAWKNFFDEDQPMFTPQQTFNDVVPRPWFVSYQ